MNVRVVVRCSDGRVFQSLNVLSFAFRKDAYLPYTVLNARFFGTEGFVTGASEVLLYIGEHNVHHGLVDTIKLTESGGSRIISVSSRGFTSLLCQNQIEPGLVTGVSINSLMDGYYTLPYVTHEDNSDTSSYIYVKNNSSMWEAVANLGYKQSGGYPYIRGTNCVRITPVSQPAEFVYRPNELLAVGCELSGKHLISDFHMADISGNYGTFELEDQDVLDAQIVRHKFFELDMEFVRNPSDALVYRDKYAYRGHFKHFCTYSGYNGEDLSDIITFGSVSQKRITSLDIIGTHSGISTTIGIYQDKFPHGS